MKKRRATYQSRDRFNIIIALLACLTAISFGNTLWESLVNQSPSAIEPEPSSPEGTDLTTGLTASESVGAAYQDTLTSTSQPANADQPQLTTAATYTPPREKAPAHPSNFGDRYATDASGQAVNHELLLVLHETGWTANSAINVFKRNHPFDNDQVSYHQIIRRNGAVIDIVPLEKRAYGAGNSEFQTPQGPEAVQTNPNISSSVNNFAYHISLESPPNVSWQASGHSGYTNEQYRSLAWLIVQENVAYDRITTHAAIDRLGARSDPRNFSFEKLAKELENYPPYTAQATNQR